MADGKLLIVGMQMHMQDPPGTRRGFPEFPDLLQSPYCIDDDDIPGGGTVDKMPHRAHDPAAPLEAGAEPQSLEPAPVKLVVGCGG